MDVDTGFIRAGATRDKGSELQAQYNAADPFPSIVIDDFLPERVANGILDHFGPGSTDEGLNASYERAQERLKSSYHPDTLDDYAPLAVLQLQLASVHQAHREHHRDKGPDTRSLFLGCRVP
ncbi:hypothetical protein [Sphingomonas guangdongensis]|uniref:hypothetical protein n=1 Tax=Sphingomonas guangdongensis TaxID=1141890 RepID=UPI001FE86C32|nr:hypothetical protein [Sphingomonas guangdongensis]